MKMVLIMLCFSLFIIIIHNIIQLYTKFNSELKLECKLLVSLSANNMLVSSA